MKGRYLTDYNGITYDYSPDSYCQLTIYIGDNPWMYINGGVAPASVGRLIDEHVRSFQTEDTLKNVDDMRGWVIVKKRDVETPH